MYCKSISRSRSPSIAHPVMPRKSRPTKSTNGRVLVMAPEASSGTSLMAGERPSLSAMTVPTSDDIFDMSLPVRLKSCLLGNSRGKARVRNRSRLWDDNDGFPKNETFKTPVGSEQKGERQGEDQKMKTKRCQRTVFTLNVDWSERLPRGKGVKR